MKMTSGRKFDNIQSIHFSDIQSENNERFILELCGELPKQLSLIQQHNLTKPIAPKISKEFAPYNQLLSKTFQQLQTPPVKNTSNDPNLNPMGFLSTANFAPSYSSSQNLGYLSQYPMPKTDYPGSQ
jgi:hypothetical protein